MKTGPVQGPGRPNVGRNSGGEDHVFSMGAWIIALLLVFTVLVVPGVVRAVTITWTTTADFDAGTKSWIGPGADGNLGTETSTDNLGIAAGAFEISNMKGDSFTLADSDANTFKWDPTTRGTCAARSITGGIYQISITAGTFTTCGSVGAAKVSGAFDIRIKGSTSPDGTNRQIGLCAFDTIASTTTCTPGVGETPNGIWYRNLIDTILDAFTVTAGAGTQIGTSTNPGCEPYWLRITRSGTTITWYYSCDGSAWTQDETATFSTASDLQISFGVTNNGGTPGVGSIDDWYVASGAVGSGGFRPTGSWISAVQTFDGMVPSQVTLAYSGVSSAIYIDQILIVDSSGVTLSAYDTDITSGSSVVVQVPYTEGLLQDWSVQIILASDGSGTPTIESVTVDTSPPSGGGELPPRSFPGFDLSCTHASGSIHCVVILPPVVGVRILQSQWYVDESFRGYGVPVDDARQEITLGSPWILSLYRGDANITVLVLLSNGQEIRQSSLLTVDNSWITFLLVLGSVVLVSVVLLGIMGRLELRKTRIERRRTTKKENWRWKLFPK